MCPKVPAYFRTAAPRISRRRRSPTASPLNPSYLFNQSAIFHLQRGRGGHVDDARRAASNVTAASLVGRQSRVSEKFLKWFANDPRRSRQCGFNREITFRSVRHLLLATNSNRTDFAHRADGEESARNCRLL